ncbi:ADP-ribosylglycohydrolase family protein [Frondihabitans sp. PAMC 28766]|uniref:ADP-ribosylglycohydrolase family protein n=1 Tax=Frondihabitans sp. PAMC 28766 TaxID=1795630 RepID=UPI000A5D2F8F|nr:ADP-ribosylglycohydrolase family protein [Frondihabitans sp. PAMC 28766]
MSTTDRATGALVGMACGDALGAGYEFGPALPDDRVVRMKGGGGFMWEPGEWTDDTSMAIPLAQALARGDRLDDAETLDRVVSEWATWADTAPDVGNQTRAVLGQLQDATEASARVAARAEHERYGQSGGNGSLMRTAPVALGHLSDPEGLVATARRVSDLTHFDEDAGDACVIWCLAIRRAIVDGELDVRSGIDALPSDRRQRWHDLLDVAEASQPRDFTSNGWVVEAVQGAWSAITHGTTLVDMLERAVRGGNDTDTVAAIAGGLAGAFYGASAVPPEWREIVHGWPGLRFGDLVELAEAAI